MQWSKESAVSNNHACAKVAFFAPVQVACIEKFKYVIQYTRPRTITSAVHISHLIVEIFTFKKYIPVEKNSIFFLNKFPIIEYFECPTRIEEVPKGI